MSRLERIARRLARRGSMQQMDDVARLAASLSPVLRDYRLMRVAAVTGDVTLTEQLALGAARGRTALAGIRAAAAAVVQDPSDISARSVLWPLRRPHLESLGWLLFNQNVGPTDRVDALNLFEWCRRRWGAESLSRTGRSTWVEALVALGQHQRARDVIAQGNPVDRRMRIDAVNPFVDPTLDETSATVVGEWLTEFNRYYAAAGLARLALDEGPEPPYDRLVAPLVAPEAVSVTRPSTDGGVDGPLVSVVISAYRPDHRLLVAVRSVLASTWRNLEVLVVDDDSGPAHRQVLDQTAALDPRVQVHQMPRNGGTYAIRNAALGLARGEFMTFHDSDDWAHPERLAVQARHLVNNPLVPANITMSLRVTERLELVNVRSLGMKICEPSLMFRRGVVTARIGGFDHIRKAGDAEFRQRIEAGFSTTVPALLPKVPLTLQLVNQGSLSGGDISRYRVSIDRRIHRSCYEAWHAEVRNSGGIPHVPLDSRGDDRPYYAPAAIAGTDTRPGHDVEIECDWLAAPAREQRAQVARAEELARTGVRVALRQRSRPGLDRVPLLTPHPTVIRALNRGRLGFIHGDD